MDNDSNVLLELWVFLLSYPFLRLAKAISWFLYLFSFLSGILGCFSFSVLSYWIQGGSGNPENGLSVF